MDLMTRKGLYFFTVASIAKCAMPTILYATQRPGIVINVGACSSVNNYLKSIEHARARSLYR